MNNCLRDCVIRREVEHDNCFDANGVRLNPALREPTLPVDPPSVHVWTELRAGLGYCCDEANAHIGRVVSLITIEEWREHCAKALESRGSQGGDKQ